MRIWQVPFEELDDQRVIAQHSEWHAISVLVWQKGYSWKGWEKPQHALAFMNVHQRAVKELKARGYTGHHTPVEIPEFVKQQVEEVRQTKRRVNPADLDEERWLLWNRWGGIYKGPGKMPYEYIGIRARYWMLGGCVHNEGVQVLQRHPDRVELCATCKRYVRINGGLWMPRFGQPDSVNTVNGFTTV